MKPHISISAKPTIDKNICDFYINQNIHSGDAINCDKSLYPKDSHLATALFNINGVNQICIGENYIIVLKNDDAPWISLAKKIGRAIRNNIDLDTNQINLNIHPMVNKIQELLNTTVNVYVAEHKGHIKIEKVENSTVYLKMTGGCQGCSQSGTTIKEGVENILKSNYPEITHIVDMTEHQFGDNPYYT